MVNDFRTPEGLVEYRCSVGSSIQTIRHWQRETWQLKLNVKEANCGHYILAPFITSPCDICGHAAPVTITEAIVVALPLNSTSLSWRGSSDSTKSPALGIATVSEPRLMSQVVKAHDSCVRRSVCCCDHNSGGVSITADSFKSLARI